MADSIENVFRERLHEFCGMLAFHYSSGEDEEKTEEYLIKAGEEALKSSASSEALHYYQEAVNLYLKKYGDAADFAKVAMLEKNIGIALFNRGHFTEAIDYFDKVLAYYGIKSPKHPISVALKFVVCFSDLLISLYFPFLKFKETPTDKERELIRLYDHRNNALVIVDPQKCFIDLIYAIRRSLKFDFTKIEKGFAFWAGVSGLFSYSGISFRWSRRILEFCKNKVDNNDASEVLTYELYVLGHNFLAGEWSAVREYDDDLVNQNLGIGEFFHLTSYVTFSALISIDRGCLDDAQKMIDKLFEIGDSYDYDFAKAAHYSTNTYMLMKYRQFKRVLKEIEDAISLFKKIGQETLIFGLYTRKTQVQIMLSDINGAEDSIRCTKEHLYGAESVPWFLGLVLMPEFLFYLYRLNESIKTGNKSEISKNKKSAFKTGKKAVKISSKAALIRTEALKLMGTYYWLIGKQKKALRWWNESIREGQRIGARLELSRTYFEVGKRLTEPTSP